MYQLCQITVFNYSCWHKCLSYINGLIHCFGCFHIKGHWFITGFLWQQAIYPSVSKKAFYGNTWWQAVRIRQTNTADLAGRTHTAGRQQVSGRYRNRNCLKSVETCHCCNIRQSGKRWKAKSMTVFEFTSWSFEVCISGMIMLKWVDKAVPLQMYLHILAWAASCAGLLFTDTPESEA